MAPSATVPNFIEVERKFVPGPDVEKSLYEMGAELRKELSFRDSYYDSPDLQLTLADCWLRKRDDIWELKHPPPQVVRGLTKAYTQYLELTQEEDIVKKLSEVLKVPCPSSIEDFGLSEFASFVTRRRKFQLPLDQDASTEIVVDLDEADFGFAVGEVEVLVQSQEEVQHASEKVEEICKKLGVFQESAVQGKVSTFLQLHRPEHYKRLIEAHVI